MGTENLIPLGERSGEERRRIAAMGGVASGAARRRRRSLRDAAGVLMAMPVADPQALRELLDMGVAPEDTDMQMAVVAAMGRLAMAGDVRAARLLMDILGEKGQASQDMGRVEQLIRGLQEHDP